MKGYAVVVTCEHGDNRIPARYRPLFTGAAARRALASHRGHDPGALRLAREVSARIGAPLHGAVISRLLIDLNRSPGSRGLFSPFVSALGATDRELLITRYLLPHRRAVEATIARRLRRGLGVVHVAVHSFTPRLAGRTRNADVGLLYDAARPLESTLASRWRRELLTLDAALRVRRNYPYNGASDGLTRHLRRLFDTDRYLGLELEVNQALLARDPRGIAATICTSLESVARCASPAGARAGRRSLRPCARDRDAPGSSRSTSTR